MSCSIFKDLPEDHPRRLIPALCRQFYHLGWVTGTGGGMSIKLNNEIYIAPSGVQKERMQPEDLFVQDIDGKDLQMPPEIRELKKSQCTPLFMLAYRHRNAGAVIHTHSQHAVMATLLWPGKTFRCTHLEMIKGVYDDADKRYLQYDEQLVVPIIENTPHERDLADSMYAGHDGASRLQCRSGQTPRSECSDYLFSIAVEMKMAGLDPETFVDASKA
ncbi:GL19864 [Drosophila persimilis]|uniref:Probable methylthioribulose-1-phosphate dehydratase n=1 Tax=Drosophila persimilis TaxID=7234 RepID=MTNB_DROPE|nr:RecName: Full=Probable methylthioribulose-1-phosphate dehydratase; Short=MTRu-1-P dehydratase [Drosophila persimilis]EDW27735.1 GL19864 [Drosophila persimilis]